MTKEEKKQQAKTNRMRKMGLLYLLLLTAAGASILWCTVKIQWVDGQMWRDKADSLTSSVITIPAQRGNIYSSDGTILVSTVKVADLWIDFGKTQDYNRRTGKPLFNNDGSKVMIPILSDTAWEQHVDEVCQLLHSARPSVSVAEWRQKLENGRRQGKHCFNVQNNLPYSTWLRIVGMKGWRNCVVKRMDGESVVRERRVPTYGSLAANVIGYANSRTLKTYTGLEGAYDQALRGQDGCYYGRRVTYGHYLPDDSDDTAFVQTEVVNGSHLVATIDSRYQDVAENALCKMLRRYGGASGCAVLMEVESGYVLACANVGRDTANPRGYSEQAFNNVALSHIYEPGSTFKTVVLTAMLNDGVVDTSFRVRTGHKTYVAGDEVKDSRGHEHVDTVSVKRAFIHSSNVGMAELGYIFYRNQRNRLRDSIMAIFPYMEDGKMHLDLNDPEYAARITDPNRSMSDFVRFCYGYANMVSPMQVLTFYNALAHPRRQMMKPLFCRAIISGRDTALVRPQTLMGGRAICSAETQAIMNDLLTHVVEEGTATNLRNDTYPIAGKTGTANTVYGMKGGQQNNGSFVGFFPADNPKYSCIVVGEGIGEMNGRQTAVVFKEIADCVMAMDRRLGNISLRKKLELMEQRQLALQPQAHKGRQAGTMRAYGVVGLPYHSADSLSLWATARDGGGFAPYLPPQRQVPDCSGMTARDAVALLKSLGLKVRISGVGRVRSQSPKGHTPCNANTTVTLQLAN